MPHEPSAAAAKPGEPSGSRAPMIRPANATIATANDSADAEPRRQARAQRAAGRRPEPEQAVPDAEHDRDARARRADRDRARASRRATAPRRTPSTATAPSVISRTPVAPSARGRGRACAIRRSSGSAAIATSAPGQRADRDQAADAIVASFWLCILPTNRRWPAAATTATTRVADQARRGCRPRPRGRGSARRAACPSRGPRGVERGREHRAAERREQRDRAVEAEREQRTPVRSRRRADSSASTIPAPMTPASAEAATGRRRVGSCIRTRLARARPA